jgi:chorismate-pyruvate lyase
MVSDQRPTFDVLSQLFGDNFDAEIVAVPDMPEPYCHLLVHPHHMTVTVEEYYGGAVNVRVLDRRLDGVTYARKILLAVAATGRIVQFGIVRIRLDLCSEPVRDAIVAEKTPLGRILIEHDVLRRIEPLQYLRVRPDQALCDELAMPIPTDIWGRVALIHCDEQPAIELLEILAPVP